MNFENTLVLFLQTGRLGITEPLAPLKTLSNWCYIKVRIHSFIHSFIKALKHCSVPAWHLTYCNSYHTTVQLVL